MKQAGDKTPRIEALDDETLEDVNGGQATNRTATENDAAKRSGKGPGGPLGFPAAVVKFDIP